MADHKWDYYVNLGDHLDYFVISKYNQDKPGLLEGKTILEECRFGEKVLKRHMEIIRKNNPDAEMYLLEGNHEYRATNFIHKYPHLSGLIEPENVLKLFEKRIQYIRAWSTGQMLTIGKANFTHGDYTNIHHAKKMVEAFEDNIFYGHVHDCNSYNKTTKGTGKTKVGQALGCLCDYPSHEDYTRGKATNWQQAVTTFFFFPDGHFNYYVSRIFNHRFFAPDGTIYDGSKWPQHHLLSFQSEVPYLEKTYQANSRLSVVQIFLV